MLLKRFWLFYPIYIVFFLCEGTLNFDYLRIKNVFMRTESRPMITDPDTDKKTDGQSNPNQQKNK